MRSFLSSPGTGFVLAVLALLSAGCGRQYDGQGLDRPGLEALAAEAYDSGNWPEAEILYTQLLFNYPGATDTDLYLYRLGVADAGQKLWADADFQFRRILSEFPGSALADEAQYRIALTYWLQNRDFRRDLTPVTQSIAEVRVFFEEFPESDLMPQVEALEDSCLSHLARRSLFIGQFYERRDRDEAAILYYREALEDYEGRGCMGELLVSMGDLYLKTGNSFAARSSYNRAISECGLSGDLLDRAEEGLARAGGM